MKRLGNCKGGITIFQCLIFTALLALVGIIIDCARIMAAERKVQSSLNSAVRSSLAGYDADVVGDYGIFAVNVEKDPEGESGEIEKDFVRYLEANMGIKANKAGFITYRVDDGKISVENGGSLVANEPDTLRNQILKYMKYKGPVTVTENVVQKFKASGIFKKAEFAEKEKKSRSSLKELKVRVEEADRDVAKVNEASVRVSSLDGREYIRGLKELKESLLKAGESAEAIEAFYVKYGQAREEAEAYAYEANKDEVLNQEGAGIKTGGMEYAGALEESRAVMDRAQKAGEKLEALIASIEPLQNRLEELESRRNELDSRNSSLYRTIEGLSEENDREEIQSLYREIEANNRDISSLDSDISSVRQSIYSLKRSVEYPYINRMNRTESPDSEEEKPKEKFDWSRLEGLKSALEGYLNNKNINPEWLIAPEEFTGENTPENAGTGYGEFGEEALRDKRTLSEPGDEAHAEAESESSLNLLKLFQEKVVEVFSEGGQASIEKMYIVEYIMDKFTYHTSRTERNHYLEKGEVEYILWGNTNQNLNIAKTLSVIGLLRFAINTVDYFAAGKVPHPVLRLVYSVGHGLIAAGKDTYELYSGKEICICPSLKGKKLTFNMNYSDHLRLFLLLQSVTAEQAQLNNIRQLMQVNIKQLEGREDFRLGNCGTRVSAKAAVRINLLFLPVFQLDKLKVKGFEGGSYIITKEAYAGF